MQLDPSNGCEADLSGPCGQKTSVRSYTSPSSCGWACQDCNALPGSYVVPKSTSECIAVSSVTTDPARRAALVANNNFYACSTDSYRPGQEGAANDFQFLVCDPRECADDNYDYSDGCEAARQYDARWASAQKFGAMHRAQQYWVRDDGAVTLYGTHDDTAPPVSGTWEKIVDLATYTYKPVSVSLYGVAQSSASFPCSAARAPSGTAFGGTVKWKLDSSQAGPWYHVNQSAHSTCEPGYNPGGTRTDYSRALKPRLCTDQSSDWACFETWDQLPGHGKCVLPCETGWQDCDGDPSNGCESYMADGRPYPQSRCGSLCGVGNYNLDASCGAGMCLPCRQLSGVNHVAVGPSDLTGGLSKCVDGGGAWDNSPTPASAVGYPGTRHLPTIVLSLFHSPLPNFSFFLFSSLVIMTVFVPRRRLLLQRRDGSALVRPTHPLLPVHSRRIALPRWKHVLRPHWPRLGSCERRV